MDPKTSKRNLVEVLIVTPRCALGCLCVCGVSECATCKISACAFVYLHVHVWLCVPLSSLVEYVRYCCVVGHWPLDRRHTNRQPDVCVSGTCLVCIVWFCVPLQPSVPTCRPEPLPLSLSLSRVITSIRTSKLVNREWRFSGSCKVLQCLAAP